MSTPAPATVEVVGLALWCHHGVTDAEQEVGQTILFDAALEVPDCGARETDDVSQTVDYGLVCEEIERIATAQSHRTLERVCQLVGEALAAKFDAAEVTIRAAKPEPPLPMTLGEVAVEITVSA
ncbi:MAG: dihydroneopterin aldolase [bacterium]